MVKEKPRILIITPEVSYLPKEMAASCGNLVAKAGGLADVSAALIAALFNQGADVHVAIPDYRSLFHKELTPYFKKKQPRIHWITPEERVHLARDQAFYSDYNGLGGMKCRLG